MGLYKDLLIYCILERFFGTLMKGWNAYILGLGVIIKC